jgi:hypothetical protein
LTGGLNATGKSTTETEEKEKNTPELEKNYNYRVKQTQILDRRLHLPTTPPQYP